MGKCTSGCMKNSECDGSCDILKPNEDELNVAINFALDSADGEGLMFLEAWREGDWETIEKEFPEFNGYTGEKGVDEESNKLPDAIPFNPGNCETCGHWDSKLIKGTCKSCIDKYNITSI